MKRKYIVAIASVVGAVSGVAVYLWGKNRENAEDGHLSIEVSPDVPDELVPEAREAGLFIAESCESEDVSVTEVCEFADYRAYTVVCDGWEKRVLVDNDGTKELGNLHKACDTYCTVG